MSYILDALKKSQQERELGAVPTLEAGELFMEDRQTRSRSLWGPLAVALAVLALAVAVYAAWRTPEPVPARPPVSLPDDVARPPAPPAPDTHSRDLAPAPKVTATPLVEPPPRPPARRQAPGPSSDAPPDHAIDPRWPEEEHLQAQGLGIRLGADDLDAAGNLDPELEWRLRQQLAAESASAAGQPEHAPPIIAGPTPIPPDLVRDVENFKQQVRRERAIPPPSSRRPKKSALKGDLTRLRLTPAQQAELPAYLMTAHVYADEPAQRFIVINTLQYREGEQTREGFWVERIIPQGAVLSYRGSAFFVAR